MRACFPEQRLAMSAQEMRRRQQLFVRLHVLARSYRELLPGRRHEVTAA